MWDTAILTDKKIKHNRPDITVHDKILQTCISIDLLLPVCKNIVSKTREKFMIYEDQEIKPLKIWNLIKVLSIAEQQFQNLDANSSRK